jgi:hypothetical protein
MTSSVVQGRKLQKFKKIPVSNMGMSKKKQFSHRATNFRWMCSRFLASVAVTEFHAVEAYSGLCLTGVKYNISGLSGVEKKQVTVHIKPSVLTDWEKM